MSADAGTYTFVASGATLDGSGSEDSEGGTLTYAWTETSAVGVTLADEDTDTPTISFDFTADAVAVEVTVELEVSNGTETSTDETTLILYDPAWTYVSAGATGDGTAPDNAYGTIQAAIAAATGTTSIAVAAGEYTVNSDPDNNTLVDDADWVVLADLMTLVGGYEATTWTERDPSTHVARITDEQDSIAGSSEANTARVVAVGGAVTSASRIEGFTLRHGSSGNSAAIRVAGGAPVIADIHVEAGAASSQRAISLLNSDSVVDRISMETMRNAIVVTGGSPTIRNSAVVASGGTLVSVADTGSEVVTISNNTFVVAGADNDGIRLIVGSGAAPTNVEVYNNIFVADGVSGSYVFCLSESVSEGDFAAIENNDFADCTDVLFDDGGGCTGACDLAEVNALAAGSANIGDDPMLMSPGTGDYHLTGSSPTSVTQGGQDGSASFGGAVDLDGVSRTVPWSMGAYERD